MITLPLQPIYAFLLVFLRVGLVLSLFPIIGEAFVPVRVRLVLASVIALALAPMLPVSGAMFPASGGGLVALVAQELILAFGIALIGRIMFSIIQFSGQLAGEQMGFGLVNAIDPTGSREISVISELQYVLAILVFFTADLHQPVLALIAWSFTILPPGSAWITSGAAQLAMHLGSVMFSLSLGFAMPIIVIVFAINIGLGMVGRAVPQINVFMESFPLRIIAGMAVLMLILSGLVTLWQGMFTDMERAMSQMVRLMGGA